MPMKWRFLKLDWRYALGELAIVTAGVLIALAINEWNTDRIERAEEHLIVERLLSDLSQIQRSVEFFLNGIPEKEERLQRVYSVLRSSDGQLADPSQFLADVIGGAWGGWSQLNSGRSTYNELLASGRFNLIRDDEVRLTVSRFFDTYQNSAIRVDERETLYPDISYRLVPRGEEFSLRSGLEPSEVTSLVDQILDSSLSEHVISELNFAGFLRDQLIELGRECDQTIDRLRLYLSETG